LRARQEDLARVCDETLGPAAFVFSFVPGGATPPHPDAMSKRSLVCARRLASPKTCTFIVAALSRHRSRQRDLGASEAGQARMVDGSDGAALHRRDHCEDQRAAEHVGRLLEDVV